MTSALRIAAGTVLGSAALSLIAGCAGPTASMVSPTPSAVPTTPSTPLPTSSATANTWHQVPDQASVRGVQFTTVIWTGERFVATGPSRDGEGYVFLDSADGITWHRQPGGDPPRDRVAALASGPRGVVAVGELAEHPRAWTSSDGGPSWTLAPKPLPVDPTGGDNISVTDVVAAPDGSWLAVGREDPVCHIGCGLAPVRALAWTSADGVSWTPIARQASLKGGGMDAVTAHEGTFVAAGTSAGLAAIWTSADATTWSRVPDDPVFHPHPLPGASEPTTQAFDVASGHGAVVVVGMALDVGPGGEPAVVAWWSSDLRTWAAASVERAGAGQVFGVAATPEGFLATGPSGGTSCLGGIWTSGDGAAWQCIASEPAFEAFGPYAAAASSSVEVAVGLTSAGADDSGFPGAVWWRDVP